MGYLKQKYTKEYFLHRKQNPDGSFTPVNYGVLGIEDFMEGNIPTRIYHYLNDINFIGTHVLDIGFGRGEALKYARDHGARKCFGIDFSIAAVEIAGSFLEPINPEVCPIHLIYSDAISYLPYVDTGSIDVVIMLDVIEHIPTEEADLVLAHVNRVLRNNGLLAIDTPFYAVDEDLIAQNGVYKDPSPTDLIPETKGMHCNKYTEARFYHALKHFGFKKKKGTTATFQKEHNI